MLCAVYYFRLGEGGELSGGGGGAPSAVVESIQRSLEVRGSEAGECVMVRGGELVNTECSEEYRYVCLFTHPGESIYQLVVLVVRLFML